jgi:Vitamin K-dependent gamma-carboxylase
MSELAEGVTNAPLVLFRWLLGAILVASFPIRVRSLCPQLTSGRILVGFELTRWLRPVRPSLMRLLLYSELPLALAFMAGVAWPVPAIALAVLRTYVLLLDRSRYANHEYLLCLLVGLYGLLDAGRIGAVARWQLAALQLQFGLVYLFAGLAKLNRDWWLEGQPLRRHLAAIRPKPGPPWFRRHVVPNEAVGRLLEAAARQPKIAIWLGRLAAVFDIAMGFLFVSGKVLPFWLPVFMSFHLFNQWLYGLGVFPFVNYASIALVLDPNVFGIPEPTATSAGPAALPLAVVVWFGVQVLLPVRRYALVAFARRQMSLHSDHNRYFAWLMKLRDAQSVGFALELFDRRDGHRIGDLPLGRFLDPGTLFLCARSPRALVLALEQIEPVLARELPPSTGIRVRGSVSFNGRAPVQPIAPNADIRAERVRLFCPYPWQNLLT